jgi:hypothetical protein
MSGSQCGRLCQVEVLLTVSVCTSSRLTSHPVCRPLPSKNYRELPEKYIQHINPMRVGDVGVLKTWIGGNIFVDPIGIKIDH